MYKIYINQTPLYLAGEGELPSLKRDLAEENVLYSRYPGKTKYIFHYLDHLEKGADFSAIVLHYSDLEKLFEDFVSRLKVMKACGGLVVADNRYLAIFRRGFWDLPKGKAEKGESPEETAIREVMEETGLMKVEIIRFLTTTYHVFRSPDKGRRCLKISNWYLMESPDAAELTPQVEEDIEKAVWADRQELYGYSDRMYSNILDVLDVYFKE